MILKDEKKGVKWYKVAAKDGYVNAIKNLGNFYHEKGDDVTGAAYIIAMASYGYSEKRAFAFLRTKWKLTDSELQKAYKLQLKLDIPKHYTGGVK